jgi:ferredoxin
MDRLKLLDASLHAFDTRLPDVTPSLCVATRYRSSSCRSCLDVCPAEALVTSPWLELDADKCRSCGACAAVCRTGALDCDFRSHALRAEYQSRAATDLPSIALACRHVDLAGVEGATCAMLCLGGLSAGDLLAAVALGVEQIHLISGDCRECPEAPAEVALDLAVSAAEETMAALDLPLVFERTRLPGHEPRAAATSPTVSRRGLLRYLARGLERAVADGVAPRDPERSISTLHKQGAPPRAHQRLARDLAVLQSRLGGPAVRLPVSLPLASVVANAECDACGLCLKYCPHGALAIEGNSVAANPNRCTGCGLCAEVCPRSALHMGPAMLSPRRLPAEDV